MKKTITPIRLLLILLISILNLNAYSSTLEYRISIKNNGYKGRVKYSGDTNFYFLQNDTSIIIKSNVDNTFYINTCATFGECHSEQTSYIYLFFDANGHIDSLCPKDAATINLDSLGITLNTADIIIDPRKFDRAWITSFSKDQDFSTGYYLGKQSFKLIKGISYHIDQNKNSLIGSKQNYQSYFLFTVSENGYVKIYDQNILSAKAKKNKLIFKTLRVKIDPTEISKGKSLYIKNFKNNVVSIHKKKRITFIRGVVNTIYWQDGEKEFAFLPL